MELSDINSTKPNSLSRYGAIHLGKYPKSFTCDYYTIIFSKDSGVSTSIGIGCENKGIISYFIVMYCDGTNGIITSWRGNYEFMNCILYECTGLLYYIANSKETPTITFINSKLWAGLNIGSAILSSCETNSFSLSIPKNPNECGITTIRTNSLATWYCKPNNKEIRSLLYI